jgi:hypothetical protein
MSIFFIPYGFYGWVKNWVAPFACHTQVKFKEEVKGGFLSKGWPLLPNRRAALLFD